MTLILAACGGGDNDSPGTPGGTTTGGTTGGDTTTGGTTGGDTTTGGTTTGGDTTTGGGTTTGGTTTGGTTTGGTTTGGTTGGGTTTGGATTGGTATPTLGEAIGAGSGASFEAGPSNKETATTAAYGGDGGITIAQGGATVAVLTAGATDDGFTDYASADGKAIGLASEPGGSPLGAGPLDYTAFGVWATATADGGGYDEAGAFFGGVRTAADAVPTTGSADYTGAATAVETGGDAGGLLLGTFEAAADFAAGSVRGDIALKDAAGTWGTIDTGPLAIADAAFSGDGITSSNGHVGTVGGRFFGPAAEEVGGTFCLTGPSSVRGSFGGAQQ
ncbi:MAG: transferrin-binding protein-like solute binding protein [Geminicoccaceae bacterium]|nr:transferrin-binding protein-like solute binding protein [Geminicoccaceae bacterium]